jgi:hypothetical protein
MVLRMRDIKEAFRMHQSPTIDRLCGQRMWWEWVIHHLWGINFLSYCWCSWLYDVR